MIVFQLSIFCKRNEPFEKVASLSKFMDFSHMIGVNNGVASTQKTQRKKKTTKVKFSPQEDALLRLLVDNSKEIDWNAIAKRFYKRTPRQCRERWQNYVNPNLSNREWKPEEDQDIIIKVSLIGPHWNAIARTLKGRSGNAVRNRYLMLQRQLKRTIQQDEIFSKFQPVVENTIELNKEPNPIQHVEGSLPGGEMRTSIEKIFDDKFIDQLFTEPYDMLDGMFIE